MTSLRETLERDVFPAFDAGDIAAFEALVRERFAPDLEWMLWGWEGQGLERLLREWLNEYRAFTPQSHTIITAHGRHCVDAGDAAAFEISWSGTHSGPLELPDGSEAAATGKEFTRRTLIAAWRGADGRIVKWHALSAYPEVVSELSGLSAPETNRALTTYLTTA